MQIVEEGRAPRGTAAIWLWTFGALALLIAWDASGLDLALARLVGDAHGFSLRDHWLTSALLHDGMRQLACVAGAWLLAGIWWPVGVLRRLPRRARIQWAASLVLGLALTSLLKHASRTSCPWDLAEFGGTASYLSHWVWGLGDGGPGHCFPAGHASAAFAFIGGFFALRPASARLARGCLALVLATGFVLGLAQQARGAHFMSHTLWTAWFCWGAAWLVHLAARLGRHDDEGILAFHEAS
jgi:membrane-associated PAP2 superfamily phosphatase